MKLDYLPADSPHSPLVRLYDFTLPEARQLLLAILELANGTSEESPSMNCRGSSPWAVVSCFSVSGAGTAPVLTCEPATFECGFTMETWDNVAGLIEPFAQGSAGFQWLAQVPGEAALLLSWDGRW